MEVLSDGCWGAMRCCAVSGLWRQGSVVSGGCGPFALVLGIVTIDYEEETKVKTTLLKLE